MTRKAGQRVSQSAPNGVLTVSARATLPPLRHLHRRLALKALGGVPPLGTNRLMPASCDHLAVFFDKAADVSVWQDVEHGL